LSPSNTRGVMPTEPVAADLDAAFEPFASRMRAAGLPEVAVRVFRSQYARLRAGDEGAIPGTSALPVADLPAVADLEGHEAAGREALSRTVVLKLNGGLGTSMGLSGPKSLLPVRDGLSFLDIIARQVLHLRHETGARLPLVLMNSFATREESLALLATYPELAADVPLDFLQHRVPKIDAANLGPVEWPADPAKSWCPPGHGDLYPALVSSGMLAELRAAGYRYAFVSNCDNLGAVVEPRILGWMADEGLPFVMEVTRRTVADRKGGHLARTPEGGLLLRESAQCPPEETEDFQDIERYRYFNTNNLWLDLAALERALQETDGVLPLPLIRNRKPVDPAAPSSPPVFQLETAMGAAIGVFPGARAVEVDRRRFAPVKRTDDLLLVRSDVFGLDPAWRVVAEAEFAQEGRSLPEVTLDPRCYGLLDDFEARFPAGAPSLRGCRSLRVTGDVRFGGGVVCLGDVELKSDGPTPRTIPDGARLEG